MKNESLYRIIVIALLACILVVQIISAVRLSRTIPVAVQNQVDIHRSPFPTY